MTARRIASALVAGLLLAAGLIAPATSSALVVGVGDHNPALFENPYLTELGSRRTRIITPYDSVLHADQREYLDQWMGAARAARQEIVVAFNPPKTMQCPNVGGKRGCKPVPTRRYARAFKKFKKRYPFVRIYQPWNEVNSLTQPTAHRPKAVVAYYKIVRQNCRRCKVLGADIQDLPNMVRYTKQLLAEFRRRKIRTPKLWGLHNYTDVNRFIKDRNTSLRKFVKLVPGQIWLTETGGLYRFQPQNSRQTFRPSLRRQARAMRTLFKHARKYRRKVRRIYVYHWFAASPTNRWDSGVLDADGLPRPAYKALRKHKRLFR